MRKVLIVVGIVVAVSAVVTAVILARLSVTGDRMEAAVEEIRPVQLNQLDDGTYTGSFGDFLVRNLQQPLDHGCHVPCSDLPVNAV